MGAVCTATWKWSQIGKCLSWKPNFCGHKSYKAFITAIRGMWRIEMLNLRTSCWMRQKRWPSWSILDFRLVYHMIEKSKFSVELRAIWRQKSSVRLSILDHRPMYGHLEFYCMLCSAENSHSKVWMIKSSTHIFVRRNFNSQIMFHRVLANFWTKFSKKILRSVLHAKKY